MFSNIIKHNSNNSIYTLEQKEVLSNSNEVNSNNVNDIKGFDISDKTAKLYIDGYSNLFHYIKKEGFNDIIKLGYVLHELEIKDQITVSNTYTCEDAFTDFEETQHLFEKYSCKKGFSVDSYSYKIVNDKYYKLYGTEAPKINVLGTKYDDNLPTWEYSKRINSYVHLFSYERDICSTIQSNYYELELAKVIDNKMIIEISYLNYSAKIESCTSDGKMIYLYEINGLENSVTNEKDLKKIYTSNKESLPRLTFTFEKINDNYILISVI